MEKKNTSLRSALGKARGLGSARDGVKHWWLVRVTSVPLVFLSFYILWQWPMIVTHDRLELVNWLQQPIPAIATIIFIIAAFYHACLGMEEVIIDYVPHDGAKILSLVINKMFFLTLGVAALFAVLKINFGAV